MAEKTYAQAINEAICEEMRRDPTVFLMGEDVGVFGGAFKVTVGILDEFGPERVRDTPIAELGIVGLATGAALTGTRPIAEVMYVDFTTLAMDQIVQQAAKVRYMFGGKARVPLVVRTQQGSGRGNAAQHSQSLEAWFFHVPGLYVAQPSVPADAKGMLKTAIRDDNPVIFLEHKLLYPVKGEVPDGDYLIPLGKGDIKRPGRDVTVVATSRMVHFTLQAAEGLAKEGIECEVVDPRWLVPLDVDLIVDSVKKTHKCVVVHEAVERGGIGGEIAAQVMEQAFGYLDAPVKRVTAPNAPIPFNERLEASMIPSAERIAAGIRAVL
jgi:pyruvate dehydrogenase E1 component beta subunit